jgi:aromatic-L-amino-acid decarboxylase
MRLIISFINIKAHSCVEKAGMIAMVKIRLLDTDENYSMRGSTVEKALKDDRSNGFIPFFVSYIEIELGQIGNPVNPKS